MQIVKKGRNEETKMEYNGQEDALGGARHMHHHFWEVVLLCCHHLHVS